MIVTTLTVASHLVFRQYSLFVPLSGVLFGVVGCGNAVILFDFILER